MVSVTKRAYRRLRSIPMVNRGATSLLRPLARGRSVPFFVDHLPRLGPVVAPPKRRILRLIAAPAEEVANHVFWKGCFGYEQETAPTFFERASNARAVIDVGAC